MAAFLLEINEDFLYNTLQKDRISMKSQELIRNLAIIAHIDHGKTTMLDAMLRQSSLFREGEELEERIMDSYDQEKERGITIFSKHTSIPYGEYKINLIDTPGHSDFSGEVERVLGMVNSVLLLVDAQDGPMPQTRFVLSKALKMGLRPIVVINKADRPHATPDKALDATFDLFVELGATNEQLDFAHCYASGLAGWATSEIDDERVDMKPLYQMILDKVPAPDADPEAPFLMQAMTLGYNDFVGRQATGRVLKGSLKKNDQVVRVDAEGNSTRHTITRIEGHRGLEKIELEVAEAGDIVTLSGVPEVMLGDAICDRENPITLPPIALEEPTVSINLMINSSPFAGKEGKNVTFNKIRERLEREARANISLRISQYSGKEEAMTIAGRGELHLSVLIEAMRREGFEMTLSKPQVLTHEKEGVLCEPFEIAHVEVPEEHSGSIIEALSKRKGEMQSLETNEHGISSIDFLIPTRGLMGYRNEFLTVTRGLGILTTLFDSFKPWKGEIPGRSNGVMISMCDGRANAYAAFTLQQRAELFVAPPADVYEGMVVGENSRDNDLVVNITKAKQLTNVRASGTDDALTLTPPRTLTLEQAIDYIEDDELVEVTPETIRLRKRLLKESDRKRKVKV